MGTPQTGKFRREFKHALDKCSCGSANKGRVEDRSMYHSAQATRFNNISPSSRSNYQLQSMRDFTRQQTLQTSFIENGNNQRTAQQLQHLSQPRGAAAGGGGGNGTTNGLGLNGNGANDTMAQHSSPYLSHRANNNNLNVRVVSPNGADTARESKSFSSKNQDREFGPP